MNYGYFDLKNKEYVITKPDTPAPWVNYLGSPEYGAIISNNAAGYSFVKSGANGRISRFRFNSMMALPGRYIYIRDNDTADYWSASWQPVGKPLDKYKSECRHGTAYTVISSEYENIAAETAYYVPNGKTYEVWRSKIINNDSKPRKLSVFGFVEFTNDNNYEQDQVNLQYTLFITRTSFEGNKILQHINENSGRDETGSNHRERFFGMVGADVTAACGNPDSFIGSYRTYSNPEAVEKGRLDGSMNYNSNSCGALQSDITLEPGQTAELIYILGQKDNREASAILEEYKEKVGSIINGTVKRIEFGNVILDIGKTEAILRRDEIIPREKFKNGDRVRAYVLEVRRENKGPQIFLSRTCPEFLAKLFASEVPEIYDGIVKIVGVARDPGSKAKIAVRTDDMTVDAVGACVGLRGIRVQAVVTELQGEKIDIVPYSEDKAQFIVSALAPAEVTKVVLDEDNNRIEVVVPQEQFSIAIGRRGQNVKLASQLLGCDIDVLTEEQEQERRSNENKVRSQRFMEALDVDEMIAHLLIAEGFSTVDEIALVDLSELAEIEGFDEDVAKELQSRAQEFIAKRNKEFEEKSKSLGIDEKLQQLPGLDQDMLLTLASSGVKTIDDLADLATDELIEMLGENTLSVQEANKVIMAAREHWFAEE